MSSPNPAAEVVHDAEVVTEPVTNNKIAKRGKATAIAAVEPAPGRVPTPIEQMMMKVLDMGQPDLLDKLVTIYREEEAGRKEIAFNAAMARAQEKMLPVVNNAVNNFTNSRYAKLATINRAAAPILGAEGLSIRFRTEEPEQAGNVKVVAIVSHSEGHSEKFPLELPADDGGLRGNANKTAIQATSSTITYCKRILMSAIFNIATEDDPSDDDGNQGRVSPNQARQQQAAQPAAKKPKGNVSQPREKPSVGEGAIPYADRPQLEPAGEGDEAIDETTAKGIKQAIAHAFAGYGAQAAKMGWAEFQKRFPTIEKLSQVKNTSADIKIIMNWIADPSKN